MAFKYILNEFRLPFLTILTHRKHWHDRHEPRILCEASVKGHAVCQSLFGNKKAMERHLKVEHPKFAKDPANGVKDQGGRCDPCKKSFTRRDNLKRHMKKKTRH